MWVWIGFRLDAYGKCRLIHLSLPFVKEHSAAVDSQRHIASKGRISVKHTLSSVMAIVAAFSAALVVGIDGWPLFFADCVAFAAVIYGAYICRWSWFFVGMTILIVLLTRELIAFEFRKHYISAIMKGYVLAATGAAIVLRRGIWRPAMIVALVASGLGAAIALGNTPREGRQLDTILIATPSYLRHPVTAFDVTYLLVTLAIGLTWAGLVSLATVSGGRHWSKVATMVFIFLFTCLPIGAFIHDKTANFGLGFAVLLFFGILGFGILAWLGSVLLAVCNRQHAVSLGSPISGKTGGRA